MYAARAKDSQRLLLERKALIGRVIAALAHDFNNTLFTIQCVTDVMLLDASSSDCSRADLEAIRQATQHGSLLTRQLVTLSKPSPVAVEPVNLCEVLTAIEPTLQRMLGPQHPLQIRTSAASLRVLTDPAIVQQLLLHAVLAAQPPAVDGGSLTITLADQCAETMPATRYPKPTEVPRVSMTIGSSVGNDAWQFDASADLDHLLEMLAAIGAQADYQCTHIQLRFAQVEPAAPCLPDEPALQVCNLAATLLIVEDEDVQRHATARMLTRLGFRVIEANCHRRAVELLAEMGKSISVLLTDVILPDGDGVSLNDMLRAKNRDAKTIFVSGHGPDIVRKYGFVGDNFYYLQKPHRMSELCALLHRVS
jgi:CheY-like chemotaxis protein